MMVFVDFLVFSCVGVWCHVQPPAIDHMAHHNEVAECRMPVSPAMVSC